ncbi:hypothetical protein FKP32DRAFT_1689601 [Trametes sanguinea]|nr:hypothetical protein FKP32DRAFT_1689601 [Trametes sanguinea]
MLLSRDWYCHIGGERQFESLLPGCLTDILYAWFGQTVGLLRQAPVPSPSPFDRAHYRGFYASGIGSRIQTELVGLDGRLILRLWSESDDRLCVVSYSGLHVPLALQSRPSHLHMFTRPGVRLNLRSAICPTHRELVHVSSHVCPVLPFTVIS